jgi:hypothetical protein
MPPFVSWSPRTRVRSRGSSCLLSAFPCNGRASGQQAKHPLTNDDITQTADGFTEEVVVARIALNDSDFDASIGGLTAPKEAGISGTIGEAMLRADSRKRQGASAAASCRRSGSIHPLTIATQAPPVNVVAGQNTQVPVAISFS